MNKDVDLYSILNATPNFSDDQIRKNYFLLARVFHPDKQRREENAQNIDNNEGFIKIEETYKILSNKTTRYIYDNYGHQGLAVYFQFEQRFKDYEIILNSHTSTPENKEIARKVFSINDNSLYYRKCADYLKI